AHRRGTTNRSVAPATTSLRNLPGHDALGGARLSLPSLRQPHGDHRDVRGRSASSPSPFRAGDHHWNEYVMTPGTGASIGRSPAGFRRHNGARPLSRFRMPSGTQPADHLLTPRRGAVSPQLLAPTPLARTCAARSLQAKSP